MANLFNIFATLENLGEIPTLEKIMEFTNRDKASIFEELSLNNARYSTVADPVTGVKHFVLTPGLTANEWTSLPPKNGVTFGRIVR